MSTELSAARDGDERAFRALVEPYRRELRAYCYRMAGSIDDADDLLQEGLLRAWRGLPSFEGRASVRSWLYRVTSSACIDALKSRSRKKRAEDEGPAALPDDPPLAARPGEWLGPCPRSVYEDLAPSPETRFSARQSVGFAFLAALQILPPKQRATLIACDVLGFSADECAELLSVSRDAVESALRRARDTIAERAAAFEPRAPDEPATRQLLARYIAAWDQADAAALVVLLHQDATMSMPPLPIWLHGPGAIAGSIDEMVFAAAQRHTFRALTTEANGLPALAIYRATGAGYAPYALQVLGIDSSALRTLTAFVDTSIFAAFDLPAELR